MTVKIVSVLERITQGDSKDSMADKEAIGNLRINVRLVNSGGIVRNEDNI